MAKYLREQDVKALETKIEYYLDTMTECGDARTPKFAALEKCFYNITVDSNTSKRLAECEAAARAVSAAWGDEIAGLIAIGIRAQNYPGHWLKQNTDDARAHALAHPGAPIAVAGTANATWT